MSTVSFNILYFDSHVFKFCFMLSDERVNSPSEVVDTMYKFKFLIG
jgi:prepilin-type processing-associated H-X9-DG protein